MHGRVRIGTYGFLVDKLNRKFNRWKKATMSKAVRLLLINTSTVPSIAYVMQSALVPQHFVNEVERLHRRFFWGDRD